MWCSPVNILNLWNDCHFLNTLILWNWWHPNLHHLASLPLTTRILWKQYIWLLLWTCFQLFLNWWHPANLWSKKHCYWNVKIVNWNNSFSLSEVFLLELSPTCSVNTPSRILINWSCLSVSSFSIVNILFASWRDESWLQWPKV